MRTLRQKVDVDSGHQDASKMRTLSTKMRRKYVPLGRKSMSQVDYAYIAFQAYKSVKGGYQKCKPFVGKCVENANPQHENASKVRTLNPKLHPRDPDERRKCDPFIKKCVENATPRAEIACLDALPQALGSISGRRKSHP